MPSKLSLALLMTTVLLIAWPAAADDDWRLRAAGIWVDPSVGYTTADDGDFQTDGELGLSIAFERKISRRLGIELGALHAESSFTHGARLFGDDLFETEFETELTVLTAGLNFHLTPGCSTDLYIGPLLAYIDYGGTEIHQTFGDQSIRGEVESTDNYTLGAQIGADIGFGGSPWGLHLAAKYLESTLGLISNSGLNTDLDFDPLILGAGFSFSF